MADIQILGRYLMANVEIENPAHGRGRLMGLPYNVIGEDMRVQVQFPKVEGATGCHEDQYDLSNVRLVLYDAEDIPAIMDSLQSWQVPDSYSDVVSRLSAQDLHDMARLVDELRSLGVALNLKPHQYIRKPVRSADLQPQSNPNQLLLF
ncbi:hypothetical protein ACW9KT_15490 [Hymenobacter sp. HD11105]